MDTVAATFIGSFTRHEQAPTDGRPEFAFIGRSNVGKSSLINMLTERKSLAHTSNKPGKTQHLNYYLINEAWYLVDLPGYGYASVSKRSRRQFGQMNDQYLRKRQSLFSAFVLIDAHVLPQRIDLDFCNWLGEHQVPFVLVFTKTDRQRPEETQANIEAFRQAMLDTWEAFPPYFETSATKHEGRAEVLGFIDQTLTQVGLPYSNLPTHS